MPSAGEIATFTGSRLQGVDLVSLTPASLAGVTHGSIVFLSRDDTDSIKKLNTLTDVACITTSQIAPRLKCTVLVHEQPRFAFCIMMDHFFKPVTESVGISHDAIVSATAILGEEVEIGPGSVIGDNVKIGNGTRLGANVVIAPGCHIGTDCIIKSNTTIGEPGFGYVRDGDSKPIRFPHIGSVTLRDRVEIGANCTVVRAALDTTFVDDDVKTDDHVHIAHNVHVGKRCLIAAGTVLSGSVTIGDDVWVGPNVVISDHLKIGNRAWVAIGSVVLSDVPENTRVLGNPARKI